MEVPFGPGGLQDLARLEPSSLNSLRQFVDEGDVDVALDVLDHLGGLGDADRARLVRAGRDDLAVDRIDQLGDSGVDPEVILRCPEAGAGIAGIDALGAVAGEEILLNIEPGDLLDDRDADFLGRAGIYGRFVDHDAAPA